MGSRSRYDRARPVTSVEADEARAYHMLAAVVADRPSALLDRRALGQVAQVLHAVGNELDDGRGVPVGVRRSVRGLAGALRELLDPRVSAPPPSPQPSQPTGSGVESAGSPPPSEARPEQAGAAGSVGAAMFRAAP